MKKNITITEESYLIIKSYKELYNLKSYSETLAFMHKTLVRLTKEELTK